MSKKKSKGFLIKLVSTAGTGYYLVKKRNPKGAAVKKRNPKTKVANSEKLIFRKYDPVVRKHVEFKEEKIK